MSTNSLQPESLGSRLWNRGTRWCLNGVYGLLLVLLIPYLGWRLLIQRKPISGWWEKMLGGCDLPEFHGTDRYWFHAVSVGEVLLLRPVLTELRRRRPDVSIVLSTSTRTGMSVARESFPDLPCIWFPWDFSWSVLRAIQQVRPTQIVLVELELWPNFITTAHHLGVPLSLINGRLGAKSFRGYQWLRPLVSRMLRRFRCIAVQSPAIAERFLGLGAPASVVHVTGSVKFDGVATDRDAAAINPLRAELRIASSARILVAGSTQEPEEEVALSVWESLQDEFPELQLVLVPRHAERFETVAQLVTKRGHRLFRRSRATTTSAPRAAVKKDANTASSPTPVVLLDTLGELARCWGLAEIAFVGGSLDRHRGGQNMIEPAACGAAVLFGPHTENFESIVTSLLAVGGALVVQDEADLRQQVAALLRSPERRKSMGDAARAFALSQQGATSRTIDLLLSNERDPQKPG